MLVQKAGAKLAICDLVPLFFKESHLTVDLSPKGTTRVTSLKIFTLEM